MITEQEISALVSYVQSSKNPAKLFEIPYLSVRNPRDASIRIGTRKVFADFPRIATESLFVFIRDYCDEKFKDVMKAKPKTQEEFDKWIRKIQRIIEEIKREKEDQETEIGYISKNLEEIGIKWWINFREHYKKPVIIIDVNEYYKRFWSEKIKDFVQKLNGSYDYPSQIYDMASELSPQYQKLQLNVTTPKIFEVLKDANLDIGYELKKLSRMIEKLRQVTVIPTADVYQIELKGVVDATFSDMLGIVHQLYTILNTGHFFSGYLLLRKLLIDLGIILFFKSFAEEYPKITRLAKISGEEKIGILYEGLKQYADDFKTKWMRVYYDSSGMPLLAPTTPERIEDNISESLEIRNFEELKSHYNAGNIQSVITEGRAMIKKKKKIMEVNLHAIEFKDTVYVEAIDILRLHKVLVFDAVNANIQVPKSKKDKLRESQKYKAYAEYHKLSDAVHTPVLVDFPSYSSTLEYLGFLHHVRVVNEVFQEVLQAYKTCCQRRKE
ncbi:hypothetical protein [Thermococcus sp. LS2]|uniref:hypothetical protein n=1 Tax=Thermococcus sp. LS2 TaxID=1638260 RepID=UPI00143A2FCE|nr:hypothetical protein [Thermococcus sp. LS2]NJE12129.1 hypothetical protein [Thermococcus sp. LS2]